MHPRSQTSAAALPASSEPATTAEMDHSRSPSGKMEGEAQITYEVVVPPGLSPGDEFIADVNGAHMNVVVPPAVRGGDTVRLQQGRPISDEELASQLQADEDRQAGLGTRWRGRRGSAGEVMGGALIVQAPPGHILVEETFVSPAGLFCCVLTCPFFFPFNLLGLCFTEKRLVPVRVVNV
jgi:hypothetical protein